MPFYTKQQARTAAQQSVRRSTTAYNSNQRLTEALKSVSSQQKFDVFLSHSIDDAELVLGVKELLEQEGLKVYVDWDTDRHLSRNKVNKQTAELLRMRMNQSNSLIYIATDNSNTGNDTKIIDVSGSLNFGNVTVGQQVTKTFKIKNTQG